MKSDSLILRFYGERHGDQWSLICLDFNLAVQADTLNEARVKLHQMVKSYLRDALEGGVDSTHGRYFLTRRAPLSFWIKFYLFSFLNRICSKRERSRVTASDTIPMQPVGA